VKFVHYMLNDNCAISRQYVLCSLVLSLSLTLYIMACVCIVWDYVYIHRIVSYIGFMECE
jgi:hypothetical protein